MKNVCQTCLFDLEFGLPVELRDKFIKEKKAADISKMPKDLTNRDYWANEMNKKIDNVDLPYHDPETMEALKEVSDKLKGQQKGGD
jgi:pre-mRNA-splicing factor RBM22/SLT11